LYFAWNLKPWVSLKQLAKAKISLIIYDTDIEPFLDRSVRYRYFVPLIPPVGLNIEI
jgi:hypothetical protein